MPFGAAKSSKQEPLKCCVDKCGLPKAQRGDTRRIHWEMHLFRLSGLKSAGPSGTGMEPSQFGRSLTLRTFSSDGHNDRFRPSTRTRGNAPQNGNTASSSLAGTPGRGQERSRLNGRSTCRTGERNPCPKPYERGPAH